MVYITGNGLKTQEAIVNEVAPPIQIKPTIEAFEAAMKARELVLA